MCPLFVSEPYTPQQDLHLCKVLLQQTVSSKVQQNQKLLLQLSGSDEYFPKEVRHRGSIPCPAIAVHISIKTIRTQAIWGGKTGISLLLKECHCAEQIQDLFSQKELTRV